MNDRKQAVTVLIIEDSHEDREVYREYLKINPDHIYTFLVAETAEKGLEMVKSVDVDCILLDYQLPGVDGLQFLKKLQSEAAGAIAPVVMITGRGSEKIAVEAMRNGAYDYLSKSEISPESLFRVTETAIARGRAERKLRASEDERKWVNEELSQSEERYRLIVETIEDYAIVMLDQEGRILQWNSGARAITGYHDKEVIGQHFRLLFRQNDIRDQIPEREIAQATAQGIANDNRWFVARGGQEFHAAGVLRPMRDSTGTIRGFVKIFRDDSREQSETAK